MDGGTDTSNSDILARIEVIIRMLGRLEERFESERELALLDGTREALASLRRRSRELYQPECQQLEEEALQEAGNIRRDELFFEETQQRLDVFGRRLSKALARFTGTPNRLLRNADTVARIAPEREGTGPAQTAGSGEPEEEELEPTDPPVECPRCGQVLYCDREMTVLVCQACGIRETLE